MDKFLEIGVIKKAHGVKGRLVISLFNNASKVLSQESEIALSPSIDKQKSFEFFIISNISYGNNVIVDLDRIRDRDTAEAFVGFKVLIEKSALRKGLLDNEFLLNDIIDFLVIDANGNPKGKVVGFSSNGAQDLVCFKNSKGKKFEALLIPEFIVELSFDSRFIKLHIPGLE